MNKSANRVKTIAKNFLRLPLANYGIWYTIYFGPCGCKIPSKQKKISSLRKVAKKELRMNLVKFDTGFVDKPDGKISKKLDK